MCFLKNGTQLKRKTVSQLSVYMNAYDLSVKVSQLLTGEFFTIYMMVMGCLFNLFYSTTDSLQINC